jgi:hypothetical protein
VLGVVFGSLAVLKLRSGLDHGALVPASLQGVAVGLEILIAAGLLISTSRAPVFLAWGFSGAATVVAGWHYSRDVPGATCGCLGSEVDLSAAQHIAVAGALLLLSSLLVGARLGEERGRRAPET